LKYYTITEFAEKLGVPRSRVLWLVRSGQIESTKGENPRSPYKIPKSELKKSNRKSTSKSTEKTKESKETKISGKSREIQKEPSYEEFVEIQKILIETMRDLAKTQEKIASTLSELVKKI